jgi:hypothetical protein
MLHKEFLPFKFLKSIFDRANVRKTTIYQWFRAAYNPVEDIQSYLDKHQLL